MNSYLARLLIFNIIVLGAKMQSGGEGDVALGNQGLTSMSIEMPTQSMNSMDSKNFNDMMTNMGGMQNSMMQTMPQTQEHAETQAQDDQQEQSKENPETQMQNQEQPELQEEEVPEDRRTMVMPGMPQMGGPEYGQQENQQQDKMQNPSTTLSFLDRPMHHDSKIGHMYHFQDELEDENVDEKIGDKVLDKLLIDFKKLDCEGYNATKNKGQRLFNIKTEDKIEEFCKQDLRNKVLESISHVDASPLMVFNNLSKDIYGPLGYKYYEKFAYPDLLNDLIFLNSRYSMIHPETPIPVYGDFKEGILNSFAQIADYSSDFHHNKSMISSTMIDLLKQFHIWWNVHRQRKQMTHVHKHTFDIIKNVMLKYKQTHDTMKATTVHILKNIKDAYYRFVKANKMFQVLKKEPADMIAAEILRRYKNNIENIHMHKSSYELRVTETAYILDLLRAFFIVNFKRKMIDDQNQLHYEAAIYNRILSVYKDYKKYLVEIGSEAYNDFKDFTATLLLKMNHRVYIIFRMLTMAGYVNMPAFNLDNSVASAIKIYYEFFDNMSTIPNECLDLLSNALEDCLNEKSSKLVMFFYQKYQLFASVAGADLISYLRNNISKMVDTIKAQDSFENFTNFRNNYFAELFKFSVKYRHRYLIKDMGTVDDLENELGFEIEKSKKIHAISKINYDLIDKLDRRFYNLFLNIKTKFNKYAPVEKDIKVLSLIAETVEKMIDKYQDTQRNKLDRNIEALLVKCKTIIDEWLKKHSVHYIINASAVNAETPFTQYMPLPEPHSNIVQHVVNEPTIQSTRVQPLKTMMPQ